MTKITYHIVEHDGGWAYRAAREQHVPGETRAISWEDASGQWHEELARGSDRPDTDVEG